MTGTALASVALAWLIPAAPLATTWTSVGLVAGLACLAAWMLLGWRAALLCVTVTVGMLRCGWAHEARISAVLEGRDIVVEGVVCDFPKRDAGLVRLMLEGATDGDAPPGLPARIHLSWFGAEQVPNPGERWQLKVHLKAPRGLSNPGGFDFEAWAFTHAIGASGYVKRSPLNHRVAGRWRDCPTAGWRTRLAGLIERALPEHPALPYVLGLVVAATDRLTAADWDLMRQTGTTHLLAISGLNIVMVTAPILLLGRGVQRLAPRLGLWLPAGVGIVPALLVAGLYTALAGFGVSTVRAFVMTAAAACYVLAARVICAVDLLMLAALEVALVDPSSLRSASFWLSFVAVGWLLLAVPRTTPPDAALPAPRRWVCRVLAEGRALLVIQVVLGLGLAPIIVFWFGQISLVSPLVNLLAVPLFSLWILPLCLIATAGLIWAPDIGGPLMLIAADSLQFLLDGLHGLAALPWVVWQAPPARPVSLVLAALGAVGVCWPRPARGRHLALLCLLPVVVGTPANAPERLRVIVLDVGQGLAVVVQTARHVMVYDAGPAYRSGDAGAAVVLPVLQRLGLAALDILAISHPDMDHRGGARSLAARFPEARLVATARWGLPLEHHLACTDGLAWTWDGVRFAVRSPRAGDDRRWSENDDSCVIVLSAGGATIVLPGDIGRRRERDLAGRLGVTRVDLLIAPHHGSRSSSSAEFVSAMRARYVVFSTGYRNRWHFPAPTVEARWRAAGACTLDTAATGALTFELRGGELALVAAERLDDARAWIAAAAASNPCDASGASR